MVTAYLVLFGSSFLAATILPFYSEIALFAMLTKGYSAFLVITVATAGNTLGAVVNWLLGKYFLKFKDAPWFYFKEEKLGKMQSWFNQYGVWSLLLSWMPIGGDALTFIAGVMKVKLLPFILLVGTGKCLRYCAVVFLSNLVINVGNN